MSLAHVSVSHDAYRIINIPIAFFRSRQLKWAATWFFGHVMLLRISTDITTSLAFVLVSCHAIAWVSASFDQNSIINGTIAFLLSRWSNKGQNDLLVRPHYWPWHHVILTVLSMAPFNSLNQDNQNEFQHYLFGHVMPLLLVSVSCYANGIINGTTALLKLQMKCNMTFWSCDAISITYYQWHH